MSQLIKKITINNDDFEYNNTFAIKSIKEQISKESLNIKVDYIAIRTDYVDRLGFRDAKLIRMDTSSTSKLDLTPKGKIPKDIEDLIININPGGVVIFPDGMLSNVDLYINMLGNLNYCACCEPMWLYEIQLYLVNDKTLALCLVDTESG